MLKKKYFLLGEKKWEVNADCETRKGVHGGGKGGGFSLLIIHKLLFTSMQDICTIYNDIILYMGYVL